MVVMMGEAMAGVAAATFKTKGRGQKIQVIIDKKVINAEPKSTVNIKGSGGLHHVKIRVFKGRKQFTTREQIRIKPGYKNEFLIVLKADRSLEIKKTKATRMYRSIYRRPDKFYNRKYLALNIDKPELSKDLKTATLSSKNPLMNSSLIFVRDEKKLWSV